MCIRDRDWTGPTGSQVTFMASKDTFTNINYDFAKMEYSLSINDFKNNVEKIGICIMSQTETICPADRRMYALRHQTNTIDSVPLICGSILSKKIAEGIKGLVLDIKIGNGAFMKSLDQGKILGRTLQSVGKSFGLTIDIVYSGKDQPLGRTAGMWCEVQESIAALKGNGA